LNAQDVLSKNVSLEADVGQKRLLEVEERMSLLEKQLSGKDAELADAKEVSVPSRTLLCDATIDKNRSRQHK
jgi:hypothetical protein